jgi:two-component system sensor kinase FixL
MTKDDGAMDEEWGGMPIRLAELRMSAPPLSVRNLPAYLVLYLFLDLVSFDFAFNNLNITPWNLPVGLTFFLLLTSGLGALPFLLIVRILGNLLVHDQDEALNILVGALVSTGGYALFAQVMRRWLPSERQGFDLGSILVLLTGGAIAALFVTLVYVGVLTLAGLVSPVEFPVAAFRRWVGDAIGIVVVSVFLVVVVRPGMRLAPKSGRDLLEWLAQLAAISGAVAVIFSHTGQVFRLFYLVFLPLMWIAVRGGLKAAATGIVATQMVMIAVLRQFTDFSDGKVTAIQLLLLILSVAGLVLGAVVSDRASAEAKRRRSEERLRHILAIIPDGLVTIDRRGVIDSINPAAAKLFQVDEAEVGGMAVNRLIPDFDPADAAGGKREHRIARSDGTTLSVEISAAEDALGTEETTVLVVRDNSQRKMIEARLAEKKDELAHLERSSVLGQMTTSIAHEINQPLSAVVNYIRACRWLLDTPGFDMDRMTSTMDKAMEQAERTSQIVRRIREFIGKGWSQVEPHGVPQLVEGSISLLQDEAARHRVRLVADIPETTPPILVDDIQFQQVLVNLIRNAIEAQDMGGTKAPWIRIEAGSGRQPGEIQLSVTDNGPGIDPDIRDTLFTPLASQKPTGLGLGLSICRSIVEGWGGHLWNEPSPDGGARFRFTASSAEDRHPS